MSKEKTAPAPWEYDKENQDIRAQGSLIAHLYMAEDFPCLEDDERDDVDAAQHEHGKMMAQTPELIARVAELEERMWGWSRGLKGQKPYGLEELKRFYGPYIEDGNTVGLTPNEARLLESLICTAKEVVDLKSKITELEDLIQRHHDAGLMGHPEDWGRQCPACETKAP